jgi:hypothetical protein
MASQARGFFMFGGEDLKQRVMIKEEEKALVKEAFLKAMKIKVLDKREDDKPGLQETDYYTVQIKGPNEGFAILKMPVSEV